MDNIKLIDVNETNYKDIIKLDVESFQQDFVSKNLESLEDYKNAINEGKKVQCFGITLKNKIIGFAMISFDRFSDEDPKCSDNTYSIWRFMIDKEYQNKGYGKKALIKLIEYIKTYPFGKSNLCWLSYETSNLKAKRLYKKMGFIENGEICANEVVAVKEFDNE